MGSTGPVDFGPSLNEHFLLDPEWRNLNNGSFGIIPRVIQDKLREYQARSEAAPDRYIRYEYPKLLAESRAALAEHLNAPPDTIVLVNNATTAVNIVLRNMTWNPDGRDEILSFSTVYGAVGKTVDYILDTNEGVSSRSINLAYPLEDDEIESLFRGAIAASIAEGKRPRMAVYDIVTSLPGVRFPFEKITRVCREHGILSLIDGAQGVGMISLDLAQLDADFVLSNCHKWLFVPRGCAFLHVPLRNQHLITSTLPTSHGYESRRGAKRFVPIPQNPEKSKFVENFVFTGTTDTSPYACVKNALEWRRDFLGGEDRILEYLHTLARDGGGRVADILGTEVMENKTGTLTNAMVTVWLPIWSSDDVAEPTARDGGGLILPLADVAVAVPWTAELMVDEYNTFIPISVHNGRWIARLCAQVHLGMDDFEWAGQTLKKICERVKNQEYKGMTV